MLDKVYLVFELVHRKKILTNKRNKTKKAHMSRHICAVLPCLHCLRTINSSVEDVISLVLLKGCPCVFEAHQRNNTKVPLFRDMGYLNAQVHVIAASCRCWVSKCVKKVIRNVMSEVKAYMSRNMTKPTKWLCLARLGSAGASAQSDQSLRCALNG